MADQGAEGKLSPFLRAQRVAAVRPHLIGRVLDFGCGSGALCDCVEPANYVGVDADESIVAAARLAHSGYRFETELPKGMAFETIAALAVLEHVEDPGLVLRGLAHVLAPGGRLVATTPDPRLEWAHRLGARIGLFSRVAMEEHQVLLDAEAMASAARKARLRVTLQSRFLWGANQLFVLEPLD